MLILSMYKRTIFFILFSAAGILSGCSSSDSVDRASALPQDQVNTVTPYRQQIQANQALRQSFMKVFQRWKGAPYRLGGETKSGVDCSAFVQIAYRDANNLSLPRTTWSQAKYGKEIEYDNARTGDLVFFRTSRTTRHVGVYLGNKQFMHASTSKGVIISRLDNPYWASKFWHFRRVNTPPLSN
ncbi:murein DD-endopeptidase MepS/Murein LD-carboxypeptidase [Vibrio proteolyticus]